VAEHGRYIPLRKVADGGMAEIFLGQQSGAAGFKKLVVLKRILPAVAKDEHFRNTLLDEAHIAMRLHHNNIVQVLDFGEAGGSAFLVLELVDGWSLAQVIKRAHAARTRLPLELGLFIVGETCRGLAYAHTRREDGKPLKIVHRDISPQNVLLSVEGEVKVTDFGIARASVRADRTGHGTVKGKPNFMSPEQARGEELDARSDVFSVGIMLYQLATGLLPFKAATDLETMLRAQQAKFTPPQKVFEDIPRPIARIINKAMKADPDERYQSAEEMLVAIEKVLRSGERAAGQTELRRWLLDLGSKDRARPISQHEEPTSSTHKTDPPSGEWIELSDLFVPPEVRTQPPTRRTTDPQIARTRRSEQPEKKKRRLVRPGLLLLLLITAAAGYVYWLRTGGKLDRAVDILWPKDKAPDAHVEWLPFPGTGPEQPQVSQAVADAGAAGLVTAEPDDVAEALVDAGTADQVQPMPEAGDGGATAGDAGGLADARYSAGVEAEMVPVWLVSEPPGANIRVGGRLLGQTPGKYRFHLNTLFEVTFEKPGYEKAVKRFTVTSANNPGLKATHKPLR